MCFVARSGAIVVVLASSWALAQTTNPDFRIRADFRTPDNGLWAADESVGHAEFRVTSRFGQLYYGGVVRQDEFRFDVEIDLTGVSGFATHFPSSSYNVNYDVYIDEDFVGRAIQNVETFGIAQVGYDSRHPSPPRLPLPANFPSPITEGSVVRVFVAASVLPEIGDMYPSGEPLFVSTLEEPFARGDVNQDGDVDEADFALFSPHFDPPGLHGLHVGPSLGDFTGDNASDLADYQTMATNWTGSDSIPPVPAACISSVTQPASQTVCRTESANIEMGVVGTGTISYQWRRNGINISPAGNPSASSATLTIPLITSGSAGTYTCAVSNGCLSFTSAPAILTVPAVCCDSVDFNHDASAFDPTDLDAFLSRFSEGPCVPANANCDDIDFNNDGSMFDPNDIDAFLSVFSEGPCL